MLHQNEGKLAKIEDYLRQDKPLHFIFNKPLSRKMLLRLLEGMTEGTKSFALLGIVSQTNKDEYIVHTVDLHSGTKLILQVFPDMVVMCPSAETPSAAILRLWMNLEHFLKMEVRFE